MRHNGYEKFVKKARAEIFGINNGWFRWFAWYPVVVNNKLVWLILVWRRDKWKRANEETVINPSTMQLTGHDYMTNQTAMELKLKGKLWTV